MREKSARQKDNLNPYRCLSLSFSSSPAKLGNQVEPPSHPYSSLVPDSVSVSVVVGRIAKDIAEFRNDLATSRESQPLARHGNKKKKLARYRTRLRVENAQRQNGGRVSKGSVGDEVGTKADLANFGNKDDVR